MMSEPAAIGPAPAGRAAARESSGADRERARRPFNLRDCVTGCLDLVASQANEKGLALTCSIAEQTPDELIGDAGSLRQVLGHLLSNAVASTTEGGVSVRIEAQGMSPLAAGALAELPVSRGGSSAGAHRLLITVEDTGAGIPPNRMNRLFRRFSQVGTAPAESFGFGGGPGLTISRRLVEEMGGEIWAESETGRGSRFRFTLCAEARTGSHRCCRSDSPRSQP